MAYDAIEPFGDKRGDWQAATICASMFNARFSGNKISQMFQPKDFLLIFKDPEAVNELVKEVEKGTKGTPWQTMKFYARMHVAIANAEEKKLQNKKRR